MAALPTRGIVQAQHPRRLRVNKSRNGRTVEIQTVLEAGQMEHGAAERQGFADRLGSARETFRTRLHRFRVYRATRLELTKLTDRELSDLGLNRSMIRALAREAAEKA
jgi:uncharacterized protein YjiS (DUF1127 family)